MTCEAARQRIVLSLYGELADDGRLEVEAHVRDCPGCAAFLAEERRLLLLLSQRSSGAPPAGLLERCRADLAAAIAAETAAGEPVRAVSAASPGVLARLLPGGRAPRPVRLATASLAAAALLACGFLAGRFASLLQPDGPDAGAALEARPGEPGSTVAGVSHLEADQESDRVSLSYDVLRRASLEGSARDPRIRRLLVETARESLNAGLRLEALEVLGRQVEDRDAREALLWAVQEDDNPGARLMAVEALGHMAGRDAAVREAIVGALLGDDNPGVRVRAIDALGAARSPETNALFERLAREDPNEYVRLRSAAFVSSRAASGGLQ